MSKPFIVGIGFIVVAIVSASHFYNIRQANKRITDLEKAVDVHSYYEKQEGGWKLGGTIESNTTIDTSRYNYGLPSWKDSYGKLSEQIANWLDTVKVIPSRMMLPIMKRGDLYFDTTDMKVKMIP